MVVASCRAGVFDVCGADGVRKRRIHTVSAFFVTKHVYIETRSYLVAKRAEHHLESGMQQHALSALFRARARGFRLG